MLLPSFGEPALEIELISQFGVSVGKVSSDFLEFFDYSVFRVVVRSHSLSFCSSSNVIRNIGRPTRQRKMIAATALPSNKIPAQSNALQPHSQCNKEMIL